MGKLSLPCGHEVDETAARYVSTDVRNFYTCRVCQPPRTFMAEPFHWREIQRKAKVKSGTTITAPSTA